MIRFACKAEHKGAENVKIHFKNIEDRQGVLADRRLYRQYRLNGVSRADAREMMVYLRGFAHGEVVGTVRTNRRNVRI